MSARRLAILIFCSTWASLSILDALLAIKRLDHFFVAFLYALAFWAGAKWQREVSQ